MTEQDRQRFIEQMEEIGDIWEDADVERVYGGQSLEDALNDRLSDMNIFGNIIGSILNNQRR